MTRSGRRQGLDPFQPLAAPDIKAAAVRGAGFAFGGQWVRQGIGIGATLVLARLLAPEDFGLVAMVTAITGMLEMYKDLGLSAATIQAPRLEPRQVSDLFWINTGLTLLVVTLLAAGAPWIAAFYQRPELAAVTWVLAGGFLAAGLSIQHWALMRRALRFGTLAAIETAGIGLAVAVAIGLALAGWRHWALVGLIVTPRIVNLAGAWLACPWRPYFGYSGTGLGPLFAFGWKLSACNALTTFAAGMDSVLIGRAYGGVELGFYNRALQVRGVFSGLMDIPLNSIAVSTLSRLQDDPPRFHDAYRRLLYLFQAALVPFWLVTFLCPGALLRLVFGPQWAPSAPVVRILGFLLLTQPLQGLLSTLLVATGRSGTLLGWGLVSSALLLAGLTAGLLAGGVEGLAAGYAAAALASVATGILIAGRGRGLPGLRALAQPALFPLIAGAASAGAGLLAWRAADALAGPFPAFVEGWAAGLIACGLYALVMLLDLRRRHYMGLTWRLFMPRRGRGGSESHD